MKAPDFRYERPGTVAEALALLGDGAVDAQPLAGGQSLMPMMNFRLAAPDVLVDLGGVAELRGICDDGDWVAVGAMTTYSAMAASSLVAETLPIVSAALPHIAHPAIRNRGTIGGSVALSDPAAEMPAICLALGAEIELAGPAGVRRVAADDFFVALYETDRAEDEIVTVVRFPKAGAFEGFGFHELARRHGDYAMAGVALTRSGTRNRIAFFGVSDKAVRASGAEAALAANPDDLDGAVAALSELDVVGDMHVSEAARRHMAGVVLRRAWSGASA